MQSDPADVTGSVVLLGGQEGLDRGLLGSRRSFTLFVVGGDEGQVDVRQFSRGNVQSEFVGNSTLQNFGLDLRRECIVGSAQKTFDVVTPTLDQRTSFVPKNITEEQTKSDASSGISDHRRVGLVQHHFARRNRADSLEPVIHGIDESVADRITADKDPLTRNEAKRGEIQSGRQQTRKRAGDIDRDVCRSRLITHDRDVSISRRSRLSNQSASHNFDADISHNCCHLVHAIVRGVREAKTADERTDHETSSSCDFIFVRVGGVDVDSSHNDLALPTNVGEHESLHHVGQIVEVQVVVETTRSVQVRGHTFAALTRRVDRIRSDCGDLTAEVVVAVRLKTIPDRSSTQTIFTWEQTELSFLSIGEAGDVGVNLRNLCHSGLLFHFMVFEIDDHISSIEYAVFSHLADSDPPEPDTIVRRPTFVSIACNFSQLI